MERLENQFVHRLVTFYIYHSFALYEESLRSPEVDLRGPLVSTLLAPAILFGTQYAERKDLIDQRVCIYR